MKKLVLFFAIFMALVVSGCNSNVATPTVSVPTAAPTATVQPTPLPTATPELYKVTVKFSYDPTNYGTYSIDWKFTEDKNGVEKKEAWNRMASESNEVKSLCSYMYFASSYEDGIFVDNIGDIWSQKPLSPECVSALERFSGQKNLVLPDQTLGDSRVIKCGGSCKATTNDLIEKAKANLFESSVVAQNGNQWFTVQEDRTRIEPNFEGYPGFGTMKFEYPTKIIMEKNSIIEDMSISFDGAKITYFESVPLDGEMDIVLPEGSEKTDNKMYAENSWSYHSTVEVEDGLYLTWYFIPVFTNNEKVEINIIDVQMTKFSETSKPKMEDSYNGFMHKAHDTKVFFDGEEVVLKDIVYKYYTVQETENWKTWVRMTEALVIEKENGQTLFVQASVDYPCGDSRCMGDFGIQSEIGKTMFATVGDDGTLIYFTIK